MTYVKPNTNVSTFINNRIHLKIQHLYIIFTIISFFMVSHGCCTTGRSYQMSHLVKMFAWLVVIKHCAKLLYIHSILLNYVSTAATVRHTSSHSHLHIASHGNFILHVYIADPNPEHIWLNGHGFVVDVVPFCLPLITRLHDDKVGISTVVVVVGRRADSVRFSSCVVYIFMENFNGY